MPNYILSRTSPPAHIYERKINLGYGIKVDTSDAPTEPKKEKKMNDVKEVLDVADKRVNPNDNQRGNPTPAKAPVDDGEINAFASYSALKAQEAEEAKEAERNRV